MWGVRDLECRACEVGNEQLEKMEKVVLRI